VLVRFERVTLSVGAKGLPQSKHGRTPKVLTCTFTPWQDLNLHLTVRSEPRPVHLVLLGHNAAGRVGFAVWLVPSRPVQ
jgi:hypothetical protein